MYFLNTVSLTRNFYFLPVLPTLTKGPASLLTTEASGGVFSLHAQSDWRLWPLDKCIVVRISV